MQLHLGDSLEVLKTLPTESIQCCVTSPPYWGLRDYGVNGQLGLEKSPEEYVEKMVEVFREVRRVLRHDGTLWLNLGDSYISSGGTGAQGKHGDRCARTHTQRNLLGRTSTDRLPPKNLVGIPWRTALALQADGWFLRSDIVWDKPNCIPESIRDRPSRSHEFIFLMSKSPKYYYDNDSIREPYAEGSIERLKRPMQDTGSRLQGRQPGRTYQVASKAYQPNPLGRNRRTVWRVTTQAFKQAHFATFPPALIEPCILAGCPQGGIVLDPFFGAGTTGLVAQKHGRNWIGIELNPDYVTIARQRLGLDHAQQPHVSPLNEQMEFPA